jgi:hypothetical protein
MHSGNFPSKSGGASHRSVMVNFPLRDMRPHLSAAMQANFFSVLITILLAIMHLDAILVTYDPYNASESIAAFDWQRRWKFTDGYQLPLLVQHRFI